ncbi:hypothetical protein DPMN_098477 [Dreissena polymorpha]|uniref:Endonuclease/exonuclease/phosphatase domain-containing protein n=1 Tax=Dreissena polymorpha TaxID=45954 RepID=A0A9D4R6Q8_DREPO|nr:hypothetical protein DPMN_098477 [Dreissena polymorpha]
MAVIQSTTHSCNVLTWNVRGIISSAGILSHLLDEHSVDIAIVTEQNRTEQIFITTCT